MIVPIWMGDYYSYYCFHPFSDMCLWILANFCHLYTYIGNPGKRETWLGNNLHWIVLWPGLFFISDWSEWTQITVNMTTTEQIVLGCSPLTQFHVFIDSCLELTQWRIINCNLKPILYKLMVWILWFLWNGNDLTSQKSGRTKNTNMHGGED